MQVATLLGPADIVSLHSNLGFGMRLVHGRAHESHSGNPRDVLHDGALLRRAFVAMFCTT
jgi:hypothetical protein